jgi:CHAT domain-containing protein/Tfp pilus assembly protein PilF
MQPVECRIGFDRYYSAMTGVKEMRVQHQGASVTTLAGLACAIFLTTCLAHDGWDTRRNNATQDARELAPGAPVERELSEGETHAYRIRLDAGQFLRVVARRYGVNLAVALVGPDGRQMTKVERPDIWRGSEVLLAAPEKSGEHRLIVSAVGKATSGRYTLKIDELRKATAQDSDRVAAENLFIEGERLRAQDTAESLRAAAGKLEEALKQFRAVGDRDREAESHDNIGSCYAGLADRHKALEHYEQALRLYREMGHRRDEAATLHNIGFQHHALGSGRKAMEHYNQALALRRELGDRRGEANTLNSLGMVNSYLGDRPKALEHYRQSLSLWRELGDRGAESYLLNNIGYAYRLMNEHQKALEHYEQSLAIKRETGDRAGEAPTLTNIGDVYASWGEHQKALESHELALQLNRTLSNRAGESNTLTNIGRAYSSMGEYQKALDCFHQALAITSQRGNPSKEAFAHRSIGWVYWSLGQPQKALEHYEQALSLTRATENPTEEAYALNLVGMAHWSLGNYQKAIDFFNQALTIGRDLRHREPEASALNALGYAFRAMGQQEKALDHHTRALSLWRSAKDNLAEADTLDYIGLVYAALGQPRKALEYHSQAMPLRQAIGDRVDRRYTLLGLARAERALGNLTEARAHLEAALAIIESLRAKVVTQDLRSSYFAANQDFYESYIELLMAMQARQPSERLDAAAFEASERARARSLLDSLIEARADIRQGVDPQLLAEERAIGQRLNAKEAYRLRLLGGEHTQEQMIAAENELKELLAKYQNVQTKIRAVSPRYAALTQPAPLTLREIQRQALDDETLLLEYALGKNRSFLWAVTRNSYESYELPRREAIETAARRVYKLLNVSHQRQYKRESELASVELSRMLLGPVANQLGKKRLLIVADGALQYVPFAALPAPETARRRDGETERQRDGEKRKAAIRPSVPPSLRPSVSYTPLIANHEIINLPSASTLAVLRRDLAGRQPAARTVAVLADPVLQADDARVKQAGAGAKTEMPGASIVGRAETDDLVRSATESGMPSLTRLPFTRREAEAILTLAREGKNLKALDFDASRATATSAELAEYRIVHFATHGLINSRRPQLSGVVFSLVDEQGRQQDGFLRAHDIYNLRLGADLVVLSACQTALGEQMKGEGLVGLTQGFMYAGAPRVVASLWNVKDEATAELMKRFYGKMLKEGLPPAAALRAAQVSLWKDKRWEAPYYWAGFILQGEWN